ncbi:hypothetical protein AIT79_005232, partial [Salmonella enterica subsp. diarizonae]
TKHSPGKPGRFKPYKTRGDTGCVTLFFRGVTHG